MRSTPSLRRASTVSTGRRSAPTGNSAIAAAIPPGTTMRSEACRATAQAAPGVSAIAARAFTPARRKRRWRSSQKRLFSAEEMGRPSNVDPNAIRAVRRHKRAVAHAPGREPGEPFVVRLRGSFGHVKLGHERLRMSNRETSRRPSACAALSAATMTRRGPIFVAMTTGFSRGGASPVFFR